MQTLNDWRTVYKLTDARGRSYNNCQWGEGVVNPQGVLTGNGALCSGGFYHAYHTPELAAFLNPLGASFDASSMKLWRAEIKGIVDEDKGILKLGATEMQTICEIECLRPTTLQRNAFGIIVSLLTLDACEYHISEFEVWAASWLSNTDRSESAAWAATRSAEAAAWSAESAAWSAARSAAWSAESAAWSAESAAESAARSAESAARSAESAAWSAARSAAWAIEAVLIDAAYLALAETWEE